MTFSLRARHGYTLIEVIVAFAIISAAAAVTLFAVSSYTDAQREDRAAASLSAAVTAQELHHRRAGMFALDEADLHAHVDGYTVVSPSRATDEVAVYLGDYDGPDGVRVDAAVVAVAKGEMCRWVRVPDLGVRADRVSGEFVGTCTAAAAADAAEVS
jgi:prepilin-type N-terminal cleavage/methylation domain-containing protein